MLYPLLARLCETLTYLHAFDLPGWGQVADVSTWYSCRSAKPALLRMLLQYLRTAKCVNS